jgi:polyhydroxybutyrate depolymerase
MYTTALIVAVGLASASAQSPCVNTLTPGAEAVLSVGGRTARTYIPSQVANTTRPAIFNYHGYGGNGAGQAGLLNTQAEKENWIHVYPDGSGLVRGWNGMGCCPGVIQDDVQFTKDIIAELERTTCIDTNALYATGFSNGGFMAYKLMCLEGDMWAGIAPHSGTLTEDRAGSRESCDNPGSQGTTVVHFHGTADPLITYGGAIGLQAGAQDSVDRAASIYGCNMNAETVYQNGAATCERYSGCAGGNTVELCSIERFGHSWARMSNAGIEASDYMMDIFLDIEARK